MKHQSYDYENKSWLGLCGSLGGKRRYASGVTCDDGDEAATIDAGGDLLGGGRRREIRGGPPLQLSPHAV